MGSSLTNGETQYRSQGHGDIKLLPSIPLLESDKGERCTSYHAEGN